MALAFQIGGSDTNQGGAALVDLATDGAGNFALFTEFAAVGFLLVVIVAMFCGDTVASEASWSSLRYLLALPMPRARLLRQKLVVALSLQLRGEPAAAGLGLPGRRRVLRLGAGQVAVRGQFQLSRNADPDADRGGVRLRPGVAGGRAGLPAERADRRAAGRGRRRHLPGGGVQHPGLDHRAGSVPGGAAHPLPVLLAGRADPERSAGTA